MKTIPALAGACVVLLCVPAFAGAGNERTARAQTIETIDAYIAATHHRQLVMGVPLTKSSGSYRTTPSTAYRQWVLAHWKRVNWKVLQRYLDVPYRSAWECIHSHEAGSAWTGGWQARTGNGYYGGLQMDTSFQSSYGSYLVRAKGTANNWTPLEQMWVATRAHASGRGFNPWPNTAAKCGLL